MTEQCSALHQRTNLLALIFILRLSRYRSSVMKKGNDLRAALGCHQPTLIIADREQAIHYVLQKAAVKDMILIAGKGHEDYQEISYQRFPFSDRVIVASIMENIYCLDIFF
jgi:UDP-N-acetylmuramyl tripeptide synthase